jgi:hypothetical protein
VLGSARVGRHMLNARLRILTHLCHSMSNLAALHSSVLAQRCGNVRLPA